MHVVHFWFLSGGGGGAKWWVWMSQLTENLKKDNPIFSTAFLLCSHPRQESRAKRVDEALLTLKSCDKIISGLNAAACPPATPNTLSLPSQRIAVKIKVFWKLCIYLSIRPKQPSAHCTAIEGVLWVGSVPSDSCFFGRRCPPGAKNDLWIWWTWVLFDLSGTFGSHSWRPFGQGTPNPHVVLILRYRPLLVPSPCERTF